LKATFTKFAAACVETITALRGWRRFGVAFAAGAFSVLGLAPFHLWGLLFLTLPVLVWLLDGVASEAAEMEAGVVRAQRTRYWRAAWVGWWFGFGYFVAGLYWMGFAFLVEAEKYALLMPLAVVALPAGLALFYALATAAANAMWRSGSERIFALVGALFAAEWLRGHILTGFPWNLWGYALASNEALAQSASLFGIYGLTLVALLVFASPAAFAGLTARAEARNWVLPAMCAVLLASGWGWGKARLASAEVSYYPNIQLRIVQGNIPQAEKWNPEHRGRNFNRLLRLSRSGPDGKGRNARITHLIWPETSVPFLFMLNDEIAIAQARDAFAKLIGDGTVMILGAERVEGARLPKQQLRIDRIYNSLFVMDSEARILGIYDKVHLVPFGEYLPFEGALRAIGITQLTQSDTGFSSGTTRPVMKEPNTPPFLPLICYEAVFPAMAQSRDGGQAQWLLNLTNDAWFGNSTGPYQHLEQSRLRAVEEGLPLVRAANTGVSAIFDPYGRILASLPLNTMGVIDHPLPKPLAFTAFRSSGEISLMVVAFLIILLYRFVVKVE
jgi:apolipoprotein N-acyltransferase